MNDQSPASGPEVRVLPDSDLVTVIERFEVPASQQPEAVERATGHIAREWKEAPEFVAAVLLRGRERGGVASYSQWRKPADGPVPAAVPGAWSLASALGGFELLDSRTYAVEFTDQAESVAPPTRVSVEGTPLAHFGIFGVAREDQDRLLDLARENAPKSLTTPGLLAIDFHRSLDGLQAINLGVWTTFDGFDSLLQQPGFRDDNVYWEGVADFQPDFFDVVAVEVSS